MNSERGHLVRRPQGQSSYHVSYAECFWQPSGHGAYLQDLNGDHSGIPRDMCLCPSVIKIRLSLPSTAKAMALVGSV